MESRMMGVVGRQKSRTGEKRRYALPNPSRYQQDETNRIGLRPCEQTVEPRPSERAEGNQPVPSIPERREIQLRYHTDDGVKGDAVGFVTAHDRLFLATSPLLPPGTFVRLDVCEGASAIGSETITGKVTVVFPAADEFGFPPGIGVSVAEGSHGLGGSATH